MAEIIQIMQYKHNLKYGVSERELLEAMANGRVENYVCNECGETFDVINNIKPDCCPGCGAEFDWGESE